jgi:hypothetical protein
MFTYLRKHWKSVAGALVLVRSLVTYGGDADFVISRMQDPGWVGKMINWLINPPGWATFFLVLTGLALIWWDVARRRPEEEAAKPIAAPTHRDIVTESPNIPWGAKLIFWGQNLIVFGGILAMFVIFTGGIFIAIGLWQNTQLSEQNRQVTKTPPDNPAPPPIVEKPIAEAPIDLPQVAVTTPKILEPENKVPEKPLREFVDKDVTPEFLIGLYEGQTSLGAKTRISKYLGKRIEVSGSLGEVYGGLIDNAPAVAGLTSPKGTFIIAVFNGEKIGEIAGKGKGQNISVRGEISEVERAKLTLDNCEIIESSNEDSTRSRKSPPSTATKKQRKSPRG